MLGYSRGRWFSALLLILSTTPAFAADLVALSPQTWDRYAPEGKEVDAIYGDFVLANDQLLAVIGHPKPGRNANMHEKNVGGCLIDMTRRDHQSDQLAAFYPGAHLRDFRFSGIEVEAPRTYEAGNLESVFVQARRVTLRLIATPREKEPDLALAYTLEDGSPFLALTSTFTNHGDSPVTVDLVDSLVADHTFEFSPEGGTPLFWAYDKHFGQAYGVMAIGHELQSVNSRGHLLRYQNKNGKVAARLEPGESYVLVRHIIPGSNLFDVQERSHPVAFGSVLSANLTVQDTAGHPVPLADVTLRKKDKPLGWGRTDDQGKIHLFSRDLNADSLTISALGHGSKTIKIGPNADVPSTVELPEPATVVTKITDDQGHPIPCKIQFIGQGDIESPDFGPDSGAFGVQNAYYSPNGHVTQPLEPGSYELIISYGPEYDAVFKKIDVKRGETSTVEAKLIHSVNTTGWVSTDFHSHSTPSGDTTASQLGRVQNLLCEQIEFAPCTEHNRLSTYDPHLALMGASKRMATCVGMELTNKPLPLNHQNAFPLILRPHTQNNGGPENDQDPEIQIERLKLWDNDSDKLVQVNHPDFGWMAHDRNGDHNPDDGFARMFSLMDVVEVHPPHTIFNPPCTTTKRGKTHNNRIVNWLQLLNQGKRIPAVINTDAHYNFHGSGWRRNFVKSPTDDPSQIQTLDIVHASEQGHVVVSTGPFLEVTLAAPDGTEASPGDDLAASTGAVTLHVRVQCPNWFDIDRVQVFLNGKPEKAFNFTRESTPDQFSNDTVKFDQVIPLKLDRDTHILVAAIGESSSLGPVMGPVHGKDHPVAVSNPIYVDVDGKGFQPSGDTLGDLPVKAE